MTQSVHGLLVFAEVRFAQKLSFTLRMWGEWSELTCLLNIDNRPNSVNFFFNYIIKKHYGADNIVQNASYFEFLSFQYYLKTLTQEMHFIWARTPLYICVVSFYF